MDDTNNNSDSSPNLEEPTEPSNPTPVEETNSNSETSSEQNPSSETDKPKSDENKDAVKNTATEPNVATGLASKEKDKEDTPQGETNTVPNVESRLNQDNPAALSKDILSGKADALPVSIPENVKSSVESSLNSENKDKTSDGNLKNSFLSFLHLNNAEQHENDEDIDQHNDDELPDEENTPLLPRSGTRRRCLDKIWLILFSALVLGSVSIGAFLLIWLDYQTHFVYMSKSEWAVYRPVRQMKQLNLPIKNVAFIQINASDGYCNQSNSYLSCVQQIQKKNIFKMDQADILFNFIVDEAGTIYEGRGWNNCTCTRNFTDKDLTIGVLMKEDGTLMNLVPTYIQSFIDDAVTKALVDPCFNMSIYNGTAISKIVTQVKLNYNLC